MAGKTILMTIFHVSEDASQQAKNQVRESSHRREDQIQMCVSSCLFRREVVADSIFARVFRMQEDRLCLESASKERYSIRVNMTALAGPATRSTWVGGLEYRHIPILRMRWSGMFPATWPGVTLGM